MLEAALWTASVLCLSFAVAMFAGTFIYTGISEEQP